MPVVSYQLPKVVVAVGRGYFLKFTAGCACMSNMEI